MTITAKEISQEVTMEEDSFGGCTSRIRNARQRVRTTMTSVCLEKAMAMTEVFPQTEGEPMATRKAKAFRLLCKRKTIFIQDGELIVGHPSGKIRAAALSPENNYRVLSNELDTISTREMDPFIINEEQKVLFKERIEPYWKGKSFRDIWNATAFEELRLLNESLVTSIIVEGGGIYIPNYELVTKIGINGIRKRIKKRLTSLDAAIPGDYNKIMYLNTLLIVCEGIETLAKRYSRLAKKEANDEIDPRRKAELERIAEICKQVPSGPARTFWEALQSLWFFHACAWMQGTTVYNLGRLDQYLYPYYKKDIEEGTLTQDEAQELLECLWVKFAELCLMGDKYTAYFIPGYPVFQQITCGGITQSGQDAVNELSYMMIQATMDIRLAQPNLSVKYNKRKNPDSFLRKAVELLSLGAGHPQFYNDEVGIKYVMDMGIPFEDAYNWSPAGCKDIALMGKIGNLRVPISVNLASTLELILLNGVQRSTGNRLPVLQTGELNKFNTYGEFKEAFKTQLAYLIKKAAEIALIVEDIVQQQKPQIVASLSFEECIENARDCMAGGAKYNPGPEIVTVGHADTYNSLAAIKKLIYDDKKLTWDQLLKALNNDFEGYEEIREMCLAAPKYGNDIAEVDEIATEITGFAAEEVRKYKGLHGGRRVVVTTAAAGHLFQGKAVGALPSGRKAWTPLSDGISPMQGTDRNGPTAALKSISKSCLDRYCAPLLNMKTDPTIFKDERGIGNFMSFLKSWYDLGIYHIQFNIVSPDTLKDAQVHPDKYRGLMVRVSGYCACFVDLYKEIQDDIIARTTFETVH